MVSMVSRSDGSRQVTYNGHPLYRYAGDGGAGKTNGHGTKDAYGTWYLVSPQGARVAHGGAAAGG
jgi:predicted lipoprotein with Yx(FWY)xxD motif